MLAIYMPGAVDNDLVGYLPDRIAFDEWLSKMMAKANTRQRVNGKWNSYSPLELDAFIVKEVKLGIPAKTERKILQSQWGGWNSVATKAFIAKREAAK